MDYDMSIHTNPDAMAWVKFFREMNPDCNVDDDVMFGWFANAMMAMHDHMRPELAPVVLPDGSAYIDADVETAFLIRTETAQKQPTASETNVNESATDRA